MLSTAFSSNYNSHYNREKLTKLSSYTQVLESVNSQTPTLDPRTSTPLTGELIDAQSNKNQNQKVTHNKPLKNLLNATMLTDLEYSIDKFRTKNFSEKSRTFSRKSGTSGFISPIVNTTSGEENKSRFSSGQSPLDEPDPISDGSFDDSAVFENTHRPVPQFEKMTQNSTQVTTNFKKSLNLKKLFLTGSTLAFPKPFQRPKSESSTLFISAADQKIKADLAKTSKKSSKKPRNSVGDPLDLRKKSISLGNFNMTKTRSYIDNIASYKPGQRHHSTLCSNVSLHRQHKHEACDPNLRVGYYSPNDITWPIKFEDTLNRTLSDPVPAGVKKEKTSMMYMKNNKGQFTKGKSTHPKKKLLYSRQDIDNSKMFAMCGLEVRYTNKNEKNTKIREKLTLFTACQDNELRYNLASRPL